MRLIRGEPAYAVYDDFLSPRDLARVRRYVKAETYHSVHKDGWYRTFGTREALAGPVYGVGAASAETRSSTPSPHMLMFLTRLMAAIPRFASLLGRWRSFTSQAFLYPAGTGTAWHGDGHRTAGYSFYAHSYWHPGWGGELLIAQPERGRSVRRGAHALPDHVNPHFDATRPAASSSGIWTAVHPRPNRLVVLKGGTDHCVRSVDDDAGAYLRASITGFFSGEARPQL